MIDLLRPSLTGFRMQYFEVFNWGTFDSTDGSVYRIDLDGNSALLVGQNGSGKSTLVDALLTLLVPPGVRNYNVAAGAKKRERDERSYVKGACGRTGNQGDGTERAGHSTTEYLRPDPTQPTILLASFGIDQSDESFTIAQVLQIGRDQKVEKTYAFSSGTRSIAEDLSSLQRGSALSQQLRDRKFSVTNRYVQYAAWLAEKVNFRPKATDILNQTVAVKDVQSLNQFVRDHMLEATSWQEHIDRLLEHFSQLSQSHESLLHLKRKVELLHPIETQYAKFKLANEGTRSLELDLEAIDSFYQQETSRRAGVQLEIYDSELSQNELARRELSDRLDTTAAALNQYALASDNAAELRLQVLPSEIASLRVREKSLIRTRRSLSDALTSLKLRRKIESVRAFATLQSDIGAIAKKLDQQFVDARASRDDALQQIQLLESRWKRDTAACEALRESKSMASTVSQDVRSQLADALKLSVNELPMVCELLKLDASQFANASEQRRWQLAIETVLHPIAQTILIPESKFAFARQFVETAKIQDRTGKPASIAYLCFPDSTAAIEPARLKKTDLLSKLTVRTEHVCIPWLIQYLTENYRFQLVSTLIDPCPADQARVVSPNGHLKQISGHYCRFEGSEKLDEQDFVFGSDKTARVQQLSSKIDAISKQVETHRTTLQRQEQQIDSLGRQLQATQVILAIETFADIDSERCRIELEQLTSEDAALRQSDDRSLAAAEQIQSLRSQRLELQQDRDAAVADQGRLQTLLEQTREVLATAQATLAERDNGKTLRAHSLRFDSVARAAGKLPPTIAELGRHQRQLTEQYLSKVNSIRSRVQPRREALLATMQRFLIEFPEHESDLDASIDSAAGFVGLLDTLRSEDLPRFENRFRNRLNEKIVEQLGVFHANLQVHRQDILSSLARLNESLQHVEYSDGTYMRLSPRESGDIEIRNFQKLLRKTLVAVDAVADSNRDSSKSSTSNAASSHSSEEQYRSIAKLIDRLRNESRWTDKVTDVRRWFDFAAEEIDATSERQVSYYEDSSGQSGGEKAKLAFTILAAGLLYQFDIDPLDPRDDRFHFIVVDEMFSKVDDRYAQYALDLFQRFGFQLLIVAPLDAKAKITEPYVRRYLHTLKDATTNRSTVCSISVEQLAVESPDPATPNDRASGRQSATKKRVDTAHALPAPKIRKPR